MDDALFESLLEQDSETKRVDYKRDMGWRGVTRANLALDFMAFANAGGGWIVIGIDDKATSAESRFVGMSNDNLDSWETTKVNQFVNEYAYPPLNVELFKRKSSTKSKWFVVLEISQHRKTPHICIKDLNGQDNKLILKRGAVYLRTNDKACAEIRDPADWDELLGRCFRERKDELTLLLEQVLRGVGRDDASIISRKTNPFELMDSFLERSRRREQQI